MDSIKNCVWFRLKVAWSLYHYILQSRIASSMSHSINRLLCYLWIINFIFVTGNKSNESSIDVIHLFLDWESSYFELSSHSNLLFGVIRTLYEVISGRRCHSFSMISFFLSPERNMRKMANMNLKKYYLNNNLLNVYSFYSTEIGKI